jgi:molybdenum cofactor synthesis domain-containing protein
MVTEQVLAVDDALAWVSRPDCGAIVSFVGTVRDHSEGRPSVTSLEYEIYPEQAVARLGEVAASARGRWPTIGRLAVLHRAGRLQVGEASVLVAVSTPHRAGLEAGDMGRWHRLERVRPRDRGRRPLIPLDEARAFVLDACTALPLRTVPIDEALGCVAGSSVVATEPVPPFVNSSMDGYALRSVDTVGAAPRRPVRLEVVGTILAGTVLGSGIRAGQAARIMTGAPLPEGADAVCMLEECRDEAGGSLVAISGPLAVGTAVRTAGQDVGVGDTVLKVGSVITPGHIGVLANQGVTDVEVRPRPRIGVLSTGNELVAGPGPLLPGKIRDANRHSLLALVRREGWDPVDLGVVGDDESALGRAFDRAAGHCDAIVTSGGVSVGDLDVVKVVLQQRSGGTMRWMQVAIRPAKPFAFGLLAETDTPVFGLPGNPVSAMVSFELFVRPAGRLLGGHRARERQLIPAVAEVAFHRRPDGKTHFLRAFLRLDTGGAWWVRPMVGQESHQLLSMAESNALAVVPDGYGVEAGGSVSVMPTDLGRLGIAEDRTEGSLR